MLCIVALQMLVVSILEVAFFSLNEKIGVNDFQAVDMGGSIFVHTFGAYFGCVIYRLLGGFRDSLTTSSDTQSGSIVGDFVQQSRADLGLCRACDGADAAVHTRIRARIAHLSAPVRLMLFDSCLHCA